MSEIIVSGFFDSAYVTTVDASDTYLVEDGGALNILNGGAVSGTTIIGGGYQYVGIRVSSRVRISSSDGRPEAAAAAVICFEWLQRPENILAGYLRWTDYRSKEWPSATSKRITSINPLHAKATRRAVVSSSGLPIRTDCSIMMRQDLKPCSPLSTNITSRHFGRTRCRQSLPVYR